MPQQLVTINSLTAATTTIAAAVVVMNGSCNIYLNPFSDVCIELHVEKSLQHTREMQLI